MSSALIWGVLLVVASGLITAPALRRRFPRTCWYLTGYPALRLRIRWTWRHLARECGLTVTRASSTTVVGKLVVTGRRLDALVPHLAIGFPRRFAVVARVRLLPGQTPLEFAQAAEAMTHTWRVFSVRVSSPQRGQVELLISAVDPLADTSITSVTARPASVIPRQLRRYTC